MIKSIVGFWDRLGIGFSGLCALHCLLTPVIVSLIPLWPTLDIFHEYIHLSFIIILPPIAYFSLRKKHESPAIMVLMIVGLLTITGAWFLADVLGDIGETVVTLIGSFFLITGHWLNYKSKQKLSYEAA